MQKKSKPPKWFKWTVEIAVDKLWVEDGFDLTRDRAHDMVAEMLSFAHGSEFKARVISKPDRSLIRKVQGS